MILVKIWCAECNGSGHAKLNSPSSEVVKCLSCDDGKGYREQYIEDCLSCTHSTEKYSVSDAVADANVLDTLASLTMDPGDLKTKSGMVKGEIILRLHRFYCGGEE
jgi:hypothetical protein